MPSTRYWDKFIHQISLHYRQRRGRTILRLKPDFNSCLVCDLGGSRHFWEKMRGILEPEHLFILNIVDDGSTRATQKSGLLYDVIIYDGANIPFPDSAFDVLICNSVLEHIPVQKRAGLMKEIERVAKAYFVQTPALEFPIEPHFVIPFVHWLPRPIGRRLAPLGLYRWLSHATPTQVYAYFEEVHLLTANEFQAYLPNASLYVERFFGLPKSYMLYRV